MIKSHQDNVLNEIAIMKIRKMEKYERFVQLVHVKVHLVQI